MTPPPDNDDHDCGWKAYAKAQQEQLARLTAKIEDLERRLHGHKTERRKGAAKMPPPVAVDRDPADTRRKRDEAAALRDAKLETETTENRVCRCEVCSSRELTHIGVKESITYEYVQPHFRKRLVVRQTVRCENGHVTTAAAPERMGDKTRYSPSFVAYLVTSKCRDSIPLYRLEKAFKSLGIPVARSTMTDLYKRAALELTPLYEKATELVRDASDVHADETSIRQQKLGTRAFFWTFVTRELTVYRYATTRSGRVAEQVLGDSEGRLVVDMYTGYNTVTRTGRRVRAGCMAHARRKLFEQREMPGVDEALELIGKIYAVERDAKQAGIEGTDEHLELRRTRSRPLFARLLWWARGQRRSYDPRCAMGKALRYVIKNFRELGCFLRYATIPPDNNKAEAALRRVALGRNNFLFVGNEKAGDNLAVLYTLVASCEQHGVDPTAYLTDVLIRVQHHPASRVEELLPHRWKPPNRRSRVRRRE